MESLQCKLLQKCYSSVSKSLQNTVLKSAQNCTVVVVAAAAIAVAYVVVITAVIYLVVVSSSLKHLRMLVSEYIFSVPEIVVIWSELL